MTLFNLRTRLAFRSAGAWGLAIVVGAGALAAPRAVFAQQMKSPALAKEFVTLMVERKLDAFAVEDPQKPGHFVAALAYPGAQLLVVRGQTASADYMKWQIQQKAYAEAYSALQGSAVAATKLFFQDMGADGLSRESDLVDVVYEKGVDQVLFDGKGSASNLSKSQYEAKLASSDAEYAAMLTLLVNGLRSAGAPAGAGGQAGPDLLP
jgi:hypothetical protein